MFKGLLCILNGAPNVLLSVDKKALKRLAKTKRKSVLKGFTRPFEGFKTRSLKCLLKQSVLKEL